MTFSRVAVYKVYFTFWSYIDMILQCNENLSLFYRGPDPTDLGDKFRTYNFQLGLI